MSKPDAVVSSAADTTVSMPVNTTTMESKSKEGNYQDARLLLHAMKAAAALPPPPTVVSPVASPSPSFSAAFSSNDVETELDLAACLVALSRSPSATVSTASTVSVSSPNLSPPPDPVRSSSSRTTKATTSSQVQEPPPPTTRRKSLRKTRACNNSNSKRYRGGEEEEKETSDSEPSRKKPKKTSSTTTEGSSGLWETRFGQLENYKARFGHANPKSGKASRLPLARWLKDQRQLFRNGILGAQQVRRLKALGCTGFDRDQTYAAKTSVACATSNSNSNSTSTTSSTANPPKTKAKAVVSKKSPCKKAVPKEETSPSPSPATGTLLPPGPPTIVEEPNQHDVVFGRGASIYKLPGNVRFRSIVAQRKLEYISRADHEKMPIAREIVSQIRALGGRFLAKDKATSGWHDVGDKLALKKTSMTLRQDARAIREADATTTKATSPNDTSAGPGKTTTTPMSSETTAVVSSTPTGTATAKKRAPPPTTVTTGSGIPDKSSAATTATKKRAPTSTKTKKKKKKASPSSSSSSSQWEDWYTKLVDYQARNGDVDPSQSGSAPASEQKLAQWLEAQRQGFRQGTLPAEETKSLKDLGCRGFNNTEPSSFWDQRYQELVAYKEQNGNADPKGDHPLARWVAEQCNALQRKRLPKTKAKMLQDALLLGCEGSFLGGTNNNKEEEEEEEEESLEDSSSSPATTEQEPLTAGKEEQTQQTEQPPPQKRASRRQTRTRRMGSGAYRIMLLSGQRLNVTCK